MKYKCIIFDCDGILVDSEGISNQVLQDMAKEAGIDFDLDNVYDRFAGKSLKEIFRIIETLGSAKFPEAFESEYRQRTFAAFKKDLQPMKGIHGVLDKVTVPYCVASSGPPDKIRLNLTTTKLMDRFEGTVFSSYEIGSWKPNPEIFLHAAKEMGFKPEECAVIEDSLAGVQAGISGGFDVFGLATESNQQSFEEAGAKVFFELDELSSLLHHAINDVPRFHT